MARGDAPADLDYWYDVLYPKIFYTPTDGFTAGAYFAVIQPLRSRDFDSPPPYRMSFSLDGQVSTSGSRFLKLDVRAPGLANGWRFSGRFMTRRRAKDNYFGLGNATTFDSDNVTDAQPDFYRAVRTRYVARTEVERDLIGGLRALAGFNIERWKITPPSGASLLAIDLANGVDPTIGLSTNDVSARFGLVFDSRDDEVAAGRGILIEAVVGVADADVAGDLTYTRTTISARGFFTASPRLQFGGRVVGQVMGGTPRFGSYYVVDGGDRFYNGLGGSSSHRGLRTNRFLGRHKLFANLDARYALLAIPTLYRLSWMGFLDVGRVFEQEDFRLTTDDLKVGGGTGLFFQLGRAAVLGMTVGLGPDGVDTQAHTRWTF